MSGPLRPVELAEAAVLADVCLGLCVLGWLLPFGGFFIALAVTPMAALAVRHRFRAVVAGSIAAGVTAFLVGGTAVSTNVALCAVVGLPVGYSMRKRWGPARTVGLTIVTVWPPLAALTIALLAVLSQLRELSLEQIRLNWRGSARFLRWLGLDGVASGGDDAIRWALGHWYLLVPAVELLGLAFLAWTAQAIASPAIERLDRAVGPVRDPGPPDRFAGAPGPVPATFESVTYRYPDATVDALHDVSLVVPADALVAVVGPNGSGKSTLARILAGEPPTDGVVRRPGVPAPGRPGGTAAVFQRPETQVLGVRVRDDVVWGLPVPLAATVDVPALLDRVGLAGLGDQETSTLSGGQLQRLAIAAALARHPALLLSDESTAMLDTDGRTALVSLLRRLPADGTAVVHVTHEPAEAAVADEVIALAAGRVVAEPVPAPRPVVAPPRAPVGPPLARLAGVSHTYAAGTPWAHEALHDVDLVLGAGEAVVVVGPNGSGKTTLAWILAGLIVPTSGTATLAGRPLDLCVGKVGLAFQHARLQLLRSTVGADVRYGTKASKAAAAAALHRVGLDADEFADRRIDSLSGGQLRRVALAGALLRDPKVLVLDEPFAGLDPAGRAGLVEVLAGLRADRSLTLVVVSHDLEDALPVVDRIVAMDGGRVVADSPAAA